MNLVDLQITITQKCFDEDLFWKIILSLLAKLFPPKINYNLNVSNLLLLSSDTLKLALPSPALFVYTNIRYLWQRVDISCHLIVPLCMALSIYVLCVCASFLAISCDFPSLYCCCRCCCCISHFRWQNRFIFIRIFLVVFCVFVCFAVYRPQYMWRCPLTLPMGIS